MSADIMLSRRSFAGGLALLSLGGKPVPARALGGVGQSAQGYRGVPPGRTFSFPADHGPHPEYRIEWWYVTANLTGKEGAAYGVQWTLFRQAMAPGGGREGWAS